MVRFTCSGSRSENITSWPAFTHSPPIVEPMRPEPMTPIFIGFDCASAGEASTAAVRTINARLSIRDLLRFSLSQLKSVHGLAQTNDPRREPGPFHERFHL